MSHFSSIVLVDDNEDDNFIHERFLSVAGWSTDIRSFQEPTAFLDALPGMSPAPDLVFLDLNMPAMSGFEVLEALSATHPAGEVPRIVVLTSSIHPADRARAEASEMVSAYVEKPLNLRALATLMATLAA